MGSQWPGMGQQLYTQEPIFRDAIRHCDQEIRKYLGWSLVEEFTKDEKDYQLHSHDAYVQPAVAALQVALGALLSHRGIAPAAVAGLSGGEIAATHLAGVFSLSDAMRIACAQSKMTERKLKPSNLAFVNLNLKDVQEIVREWGNTVSIALEMSPSMTIVAGESTVVERFITYLKERKIHCGIANVSYAFHGREVNELEPDWVAALRGLHPNPELIATYSSISGRRQKGKDFDVAYWWQALSKPAHFVSLIRNLLADGYETFVEIGPHPMLSKSIIETAHTIGKEIILLATMRRDREERSVLDETVQTLDALKR